MSGVLGRYQLLDRLAVGGMAEIFLAREQGVAGLERLVVVKRILPHLAVHDVFVEMFLQEARIIARLNHPNIVQIYELGEVDGTFFLAMEYVPGVSLRDLMRAAATDQRAVPIDVALGILTQACAGAHAAHELTDPNGRPLGLVHRDISPHNLMVTRGGHIKLLDFGIAKATELGLDLEQTRTGALKGKVSYMSPEQCQQKGLDRRSDIFALGIVLWELLTARRLFKRESELATMQAIVTGDQWHLTDFRPDAPRSLVQAIHRSLRVKREQRFDTADDFRRTLQDIAEAEGLRITPDIISPFARGILGEEFEKHQQLVESRFERTHTGSLSMGGEATRVQRKGGSRRLTQTETSARLRPADVTNAGQPTQTHSGTRVTSLQEPGGKRRSVLALLGFMLGVAVLALAYPTWRQHFAPIVSGTPFRIALAPVYDPARVAEEFEPVRRWLEKELKRPVKVTVAPSYDAVTELLLGGEVEYAALAPFLYLDAKARIPGLQLLAFKRLGGASQSEGFLLTPEHSGVRSVTDLKGRMLCYTDEKSTSGYILPRATLRAAGIDPERDLKGTLRSGNHLQLLRDLNDGRCDAGGTYSSAYQSAAQEGVEISTLRVLAVTGRVVQDSICASPLAPEADVATLKAALLRFDAQEHLGRPHVGPFEHLSGFANGDEEDYSYLRTALSLERSGNSRSAIPEQEKSP